MSDKAEYNPIQQPAYPEDSEGVMYAQYCCYVAPLRDGCLVVAALQILFGIKTGGKKYYIHA